METALKLLHIDSSILGAGSASRQKAWIDRVTVAGKTFRYTESGPQGLAGGKKVIVAISRGGVYAPNAPGEFAESYLKFLFGFLGIDSVTFVRAEGLALSPEHRLAGIESARAAMGQTVAPAELPTVAPPAVRQGGLAHAA